MNKVLYGGLSAIEGITPSIHTFFDVHLICNDDKIKWENLEFSLVKTVHVKTTSGIMPSYGLFITYGSHHIFITTDTQFSPDLMHSFYLQADIIFHDCETTATLSGVHSRFEELCTLPPDIKAKMWLYHYNSGKLPDAKNKGFLGYVKKGQFFDFINNKNLY